MLIPILKSENCIKVFNIIKDIVEEYDVPYFKARQLLRFIKEKYPDISISPQLLGMALKWLSYQGMVEKWGSSTWRKLEDGKNGGKR